MGREQVRRDVVALCGGTLDRQSLYEQLTDALQRPVGFDGSCWHTIDPRTLLITSHRTENLPDPERGFPLLCANEYLAPDVNKFADLARGPHRAAVLSQATGGHPEQSLRYREFLRPNGLDGELRASFTDGGSCWGSLILVRAPGRDFDAADAELLGAIARPIARALRRSLLVDAIRRDPVRSPGLVVVGRSGQVETLTEGLPTKQIATRLGLSTHTVQDHLRAVFDKLGVRSKQELAGQVFFRDQLPRIEAGAVPEADGTLTRPLP